jgi:hypothetical protein
MAGSLEQEESSVRLSLLLHEHMSSDRTRNIYLTHLKCLEDLERWLEVRATRRWGYSGADDYRGLRPGSKLVMTFKGEAFELAFKHQMLDNGPEVYRCCDSLQQTFSRLYRQAGIKAVLRTVEGEPLLRRYGLPRETWKSYRPF